MNIKKGKMNLTYEQNELLIEKAKKSFLSKPVKTPCGIRNANIVFFCVMKQGGVTEQMCDEIMIEAERRVILEAKSAPLPVSKSSTHLVTTSIIRDAIDGTDEE